jgi:hypothetical protein
MRYACTIERHNGFPDIHLAVLLDQFLVGQGATKAEAIDDLELTIAQTIHVCVRDGQSDWRKGFNPAPPNFQTLPVDQGRPLNPSRWVPMPVSDGHTPEWSRVDALG